MAVTTNMFAQTDIDKIYFGNVDENPLSESKSADEGFCDYVAKNIIYPVKTKEYGISGRVIVEFVVEKDGSVNNARIIRGVDPALDAEAVRVINSSPNWTPGKIGGETVRMSYTLPIFFSINNAYTSSSTKKVKLSEELLETILLDEVVVADFNAPKKVKVVSTVTTEK